MLLDTIFAPFVKERPICVMARAVLERLLDAPRIDALFARTAQHQYTRELMFSSLVQLMSEVVRGVHPTVHAAYQAHKETIGVSTTALYNKLDRVEPQVSAALVHDSAARAAPVVKAGPATPVGSLAIRLRCSTAIIWPRPNTVSKPCAGPGPPRCRGKRWWSWISSAC
jgi:hypothetical protein